MGEQVPVTTSRPRKDSLTAARDPISAFVITLNEEAHLRDCLESLSFCDELIVVDSFSTDRTVEIARELGAKVFERTWPGYRDQKAFGLSTCQHEWVINIDADERVSAELKQNIIAMLECEAKKRLAEPKTESASDIVVGYYISRVVYFLGRWWRRGGWYPEYRLRLFKKSNVTWGGVEPHEKAVTKGKTARMAGEILHFTYRDMTEQYDQLHRLSSAAAIQEFRQGGRASLLTLVCNPISRAIKFYLFKKGYREGTAGLIVAINEGYYTFMKYAKLWELGLAALPECNKLELATGDKLQETLRPDTEQRANEN